VKAFKISAVKQKKNITVINTTGLINSNTETSSAIGLQEHKQYVPCIRMGRKTEGLYI
jgi:hypothetical protein